MNSPLMNYLSARTDRSLTMDASEDCHLDHADAAARIAELEEELREVNLARAREAEYRHADRLSGIAPVLSGICHELNNPLTSIKSFAELLLLDDRTGEDREALEIIQREAERAARIVSDLRMVARQSREESVNAGVLDLNQLTSEVCGALREHLVDTGITLSLDFEKDLPLVFGVQTQLERVIRQLVSNAAHALSDRTGPREIHVETDRCDAGVALTVRDTGPGIAQEHLEQIFDPFWTTRTTGEGAGLGLSLAHSIIADHRGQIRVEGGDGRGAAFTIELPIAEAGASLSAGQPVAHASARKSLRILVVDDEGPIRFALARYLERRGHSVEGAEEGEKALALLDAATDHPFDAIVADLRMPGFGGEELFERLEERGDGLQERLIFITGDAESADVGPLLDRAQVPVVLKPFDLAEIVQIIEAHAHIPE